MFNLIRDKILLSITTFAFVQTLHAQILGNYPATIITAAGRNATVIPSVAPINIISAVAYTSFDFKGLLQVNPITGAVIVTNAQPAGIYTVTIKAFNGNTTVTSNFVLTVNNSGCSQGGFGGSNNVGVLYGPRSVVVADFNNDGNQDIATANDNGNNVSIRLGNGIGGFSGSNQISVGFSPYSIAIGDFNGDGKQDFAVANNTFDNISIRLGSGDGGFITAPNVAAGNTPWAVTTSDFNGDGKQDLAVANANGNNVSIHTGDGSGGFSAFGTVSVGGSPRSLTSDDFNSDGKSDLAVANFGSSTVSICMGNGNGNFSGATTVNVGSGAQSVITGDFNNDSKADFAVVNRYSNTVSIRYGDGTGAFTGTIEIPVGPSPQSVAVGDFNGDGKQDFVVTSGNNASVSILLNNGAAGFAVSANLPAGTLPTSVATGDFNNDGKQDFACANLYDNNVSIRLGASNEINLQGNGFNITDGANSPSLNDYTNVGTTVTGGSVLRTFTIQNTGAGNLLVNNITLNGADSSMFAIGGIVLPVTIAAGSAKTFTITFTPTSPALKTTSVHIINDDCDEPLYDFTIQGGITGSSLNFDGIDDYISLGITIGSFGLSDFSVQTWFRTASTSANMGIINNRSGCGSGNLWSISMQSGKIVFEVNEDVAGTNEATVISLLTYNDAAWHNVSCTRTGAGLQMYIDGYLVGTGTGAGTANLNAVNNIIIGSLPCGSFMGAIDETRIWNKALTQCEIQNTMNGEITNTAPGLLANYHYNQGIANDSNVSITVLADSTTAHNNGVLYNFFLSGSSSNWVSQGAVATGVASTATSMWLGITNAWGQPTNWSKGFVPLECTNVIINTGVPFMPEVTSLEGLCNSIRLGNGASVTVKSNANLRIRSKN